MTNEEAAQLLAKSIEDNEEHQGLDIPLQTDGTEYKIENLSQDQKEALADVLAAVRRYCEGHDVNEEKVLRVTVSGVAGSGKSTWINTLVTSIRKIFDNNQTISVYGPTGTAAFNAGGQTLHRGFKLPRKIQKVGATAGTAQYLLRQFRNTLIIIIDERSMVEATVLGMIKFYMQQYAHAGRNPNHPWGGIPIIILVGDDYQLPPIMQGAFYALCQSELERTKNMSDFHFHVRAAGFDEFLKMGENAIFLEGEKRVITGQEQFKQILRAVRCEDESHQMTQDDVQTLLELDLDHNKYTPHERKNIEMDATYVFAFKEARDKLNTLKLRSANLDGNPVARIKSETIRHCGRTVSNESHFDSDRQPNRVLLCKNARVTINGCNPDPKNGLFHGSLGIVRDIVFKNGESPNHGNLPVYVLVEIHQYCGPEIIPGMPRCIPIIPYISRCDRQCCTRTHIPLALAYGKTAHTFQGQNVGPVAPGRPENPIKRIIVDPGTREFEGKNVGLFYQLLSRATTIGNREDKMSSAIYFQGQNYTRARFQNLTIGAKNQPYKKAELRRKWVQYLHDHRIRNNRWTEEEMQQVFCWANETRYDDKDLSNMIESKNIQQPDQVP